MFGFQCCHFYKEGQTMLSSFTRDHTGTDVFRCSQKISPKATICHLTPYFAHSYKDKAARRTTHDIITEPTMLPRHLNLLSIGITKGQGAAPEMGREMWL